jgi:transposase
MSYVQDSISGRSLSIGLDVDAKTSFVCVLDVVTGAILYEGRVHHTDAAWDRFLARFPSCRFWACYEAGLTGFSLCRRLRARGIDCQVVAPSQMAKSPEAKQRKNDRLDALALAKLYWNPPRSWVRVPTKKEEADRQLIRTREQLVTDRVRGMNRIKSLLLFHAIEPEEEVGKRWGKRYWAWLQCCDCPDPSIRLALDCLLRELESIEAQLKQLLHAIREMNKAPAYREAAERLAQIPGVGPLLTNAFLTELFRSEEFQNSKQVASHFGLTPCEWSSASRQRHGHITRWGPSHVRKQAIEAAWIWVWRDPAARTKYARIRAGKERKIAIVAMARTLITIMWNMVVKQQDYCYA